MTKLIESVHAMCNEVETTTDGRTLICRRSKSHGQLIGKRKREHYDPNHELYWSDEYGVYTAEQAHARQAAAMGEAVWADLTTRGANRLRNEGDGYHFRYCGREYRAARVEGNGWFVDLVGPTGEAPFTSGADWTGKTRQAAVKIMVAAVYRQPCPHEYRTGSDSCPGCDAYDQYESES